MEFIKNLFRGYQSFVLAKIPHNVKKSQFFLIGMLALALPITVALALTQQDIRQRASELVTPPLPPNPVITGYVYMDNNSNGLKDSLESGISNVKFLIYKSNDCEFMGTPPPTATVAPCPTPSPNYVTTDTTGKFVFQAENMKTYSIVYMDGVGIGLNPTNASYQLVAVPPDQTVYFGYTNQSLSPTPTPYVPVPTIGPIPVMLKTPVGYFYADYMYLTLAGKQIKVPSVGLSTFSSSANSAVIVGSWKDEGGTYYTLTFIYSLEGTTWSIQKISIQSSNASTGDSTLYAFNPVNSFNSSLVKGAINQEAVVSSITWDHYDSYPKAQLIFGGVRTMPFLSSPSITPKPTIYPPTYTPAPTKVPTPTPTLAMSPTPINSCTHPTLAKINFQQSCRLYSFLPPFVTRGAASAAFSCSDGYSGKVGNGKTCYSNSTLQKMANDQCQNRCIQPPKPNVRQGDLNLDNLLTNADYTILIRCVKSTRSCDAKQNPDLNGDKKVNELDITILQRLIRDFSSRR